MWNQANWEYWRIVAKLDPDKELSERSLRIVIHAGFDALVVGGTQRITRENTLNIVDRIRDNGFSGPLLQEITTLNAIATAGIDAYLLPVVLNAGDIKWVTEMHQQAIKYYGSNIPWEKTVVEGYIICNPDSAAGRLTRAKPVTAQDALAYCILAEKVMQLPVLYLEYSGIFGSRSLTREVSKQKEKIHLFYGGGINSPSKALAMSQQADTLVIGNAIYENPGAIDDIVKAVRMKDRWQA